MIKGKKFVHKIQALKNIPGVCVPGMVYVTNDLKKLFPYIDFTNKDYFNEVFDDSNFKVGDKVRYIGRDTWSRKGLTKKSTYKVTKITSQVRDNLLYIYYDIVDINDAKSSYTVNEDEITNSPSKWIISFSQDKYTEMPGVHELEYAAWNGKVGDSWKSWFIFDTQDEAIAVARLFKKYTAKDILDIIGKFENGVIEKLSKEDI